MREIDRIDSGRACWAVQGRVSAPCISLRMSPPEAPKTAVIFLLTKNVSCGIMEAIALGKPSVASKIERGLGDESGGVGSLKMSECS